MRLQYMHRANELPQWTARFLTNYLPTLGMDVTRVRIGGALGHELYTPTNLRATAVLPNDRPYGAWLHASLILRRGGEILNLIPVMDELELDLGIIGPEAFGEETQQSWHKLIDYVDPRGWANQLDTEPALQLWFTRSFNLTFRTENYWGLDLIPHLKAALGNVYIYGEVGTLLRAGYNLPLEFVVSPLESFSTQPSFHPPHWSIYGFGGVDGRVLGRNIFLDGNSFKDSHSVDKELFVADLRVGGAIRYRGVEGVVSFVHRTREFDTQARDENFVSVTFQFHF
jgi:hypothetical protein